MERWECLGGARGGQGARLSRMRQDVRHEQRPEAAHAHPLVGQALPVRGLPQGLHSGEQRGEIVGRTRRGFHEAQNNGHP